MDNKTSAHGRRLQQQPQRPVNRQQQQSSGSGEFQARRMHQVGDANHAPQHPQAGAPA